MKSTVALLARRTLPVGVHRAAPQHQLQEPGVVGGGGDQAPASRFKHRGLGHVDQGDARAGERVAGKGLGQPVAAGSGHAEAGVLHAQRLKTRRCSTWPSGALQSLQ